MNAIFPGPTETPLLAPVLGQEAFRNMLVALAPLARFGQPGDIAEAIVGVPSMNWVTGQVLAADGGIALGGLDRGQVVLDLAGADSDEGGSPQEGGAHE